MAAMGMMPAAAPAAAPAMPAMPDMSAMAAMMGMPAMPGMPDMSAMSAMMGMGMMPGMMPGMSATDLIAREAAAFTGAEKPSGGRNHPPGKAAGPDQPNYTTLECPAAKVRAVVGAKGATIQAIRAESGARIDIDNDAVPGKLPPVQMVHFSGDYSAVQLGVTLVKERIDFEPKWGGLGGSARAALGAKRAMEGSEFDGANKLSKYA